MSYIYIYIYIYIYDISRLRVNADCQLHVYVSLYPAKEPAVDTIIEEDVTCSQSWSLLDNQQDSAALALLLVGSVVS